MKFSVSGSDPVHVEPVEMAGAAGGGPDVPMYMTWTFARQNLATKEEGRQMFYTDATGETVPASDSDDEDPGLVRADCAQQQHHAPPVAPTLRNAQAGSG